MRTPLIFDCHLDLSLNALEYNRDLRLPVHEVRQREQGMTDLKGRSAGTTAFPEMRKGRLGICVATQLAGCMTGARPIANWMSPEQAWAQTQGQLSYYRAMEECGAMKQIFGLAGLEEAITVWQSDAPDESKPIFYILSLEGADSLVTLGHLERSYAEGLRAVGPVHYGPGVHGMGTDAEGPLTPRGRELLREMERLGIILDATHLCDESFRDALDHFSGPVWASHSNCRSLANWNRQFNDDQIRELIGRGAVIGMAFDAIMMVHGWTHNRSKPQDFQLRIEKICEHIDHICQLAGNARHVCIGSDLDGGFGTEQGPLDLDSIADLGRLGPLLAGRGYSQADIDGFFHGNVVGFLRRALPA
jgi:membrane dipeptidase